MIEGVGLSWGETFWQREISLRQDLTTPQRSHFQITSQWGFGFNMRIWGGGVGGGTQTFVHRNDKGNGMINQGHLIQYHWESQISHKVREDDQARACSAWGHGKKVGK